jgi:hypothetical protein
MVDEIFGWGEGSVMVGRWKIEVEFEVGEEVNEVEDR